MKKIPTYRWMVCKGMQTVALTTTQREAEAEAARVGGEVHELMPQKNPPDPEYSALLGGGVWSKGYATPDPIEEFYRHEDKNTRKMVSVSRSRSAVEALTAKQDKGWGGTTEAVDGMKPLLFMTRKVLLANKDRAAAKFIPALRPYRLDYTNPAHPEMIFKMPVYKIWADAKESQKNEAAKQFWNVLEFDETGNGKMDKFALLLRRAMPKFDAKVRKEAEALERALLTMHKIAVDLPLKVYKGDFHYKNAAVDAKGNLILLDPLVAEMKWVDAEALWKKLRWPVGKQPKKPKAPKAPRAPKAAKAAKKATTKKPASTDAFLFDELEEVAAKLRKQCLDANITVSRNPMFLDVALPDTSTVSLNREKRGNQDWRVFKMNKVSAVERDEYFSDFRNALAELEREAKDLQKRYAGAHPAKKATTKKPTAKPAGSMKWTPAVAHELRLRFPESKVVEHAKWREVEIFQYADGSGAFGVIGESAGNDLPWHCSVRANGVIQLSKSSKRFDVVHFAFLDELDRVFKPAKKATTKKPTAKKAGAFTAAGLPRLEAKPATKKPRAAKKPLAAKKLEGKKLRALVSKIYGEAFDRVPVNMMDLPKIYDMIEQAYAQASSHYSGEKQAEAAAQAAVKKYGESKLK